MFRGDGVLNSMLYAIDCWILGLWHLGGIVQKKQVRLLDASTSGSCSAQKTWTSS